MSNVLVDKDKLDVLANAISNKSGEALTLTLDEMVDAVDGISSAVITQDANGYLILSPDGGGGGGGSAFPVITITFNFDDPPPVATIELNMTYAELTAYITANGIGDQHAVPITDGENVGVVFFVADTSEYDYFLSCYDGSSIDTSVVTSGCFIGMDYESTTYFYGNDENFYYYES